MWIVHAPEKLSRKCRISSWRKECHNVPELFALWGFQLSHFLSEVPCLLLWLCLLGERTAKNLGQDLSKLAVGCLALCHDGLSPTSTPFLSLMASASSHHCRSALPILPVCLSGSIRDPCAGLVTSYPALEELQDQWSTDGWLSAGSSIVLKMEAIS